ncbi:MAG: hypothetical protein A3I63_01360 [Betaproteobacteria bacterium RIFCSPLOWO2_02_FULL_66_14]|nr:MAG: hypothetical protein A3I63_01360 [Betaproteobacteria bacterium RIFCSPLOWO2_02_FULL_66_14]
MPRSTQIEQFLSADDTFQPLVAKTREILRLNRYCNEFLPPELAAMVRASNLRDGRLILLAANAAAGAKLRLLLPSLSDFLLQQGAKVNSVSVRVQPAAVNRLRSGATPGRRLSPAGYSALSALYDTLGDSPARQALKKLLDREQRPTVAAAGQPQRK